MITQLIQDRRYKVRASYKLMGLSDYSYIAARLMNNFSQGFLLLLVFIGLSVAISEKKTQIFSDPYHFCFLWINTILYLLSSALMKSCFSILVPATDESLKAGKMLVGLATNIPLALNIVGKKATNIDFYFIFLPQTVYLRFCSLNYSKYTPRIDYIMTLVLVFQVIAYLMIYFLIERYFSIGINNNIFTKKNKEDNKEINSSLTSQEETLLNNSVFKSNSKMSISNLTVKFGKVTALENVNLDFFSNRVTCILGHNGAGKTTLINVVCGIIRPEKGSVMIDGIDVLNYGTEMYGKIGYSTSEDKFDDTASVLEYLTFVAHLKGIKNPDKEVDRVLHKTNLVK
jgi:ABC-type multidrug transport system fused ATPase/permease subunit